MRPPLRREGASSRLRLVLGMGLAVSLMACSGEPSSSAELTGRWQEVGTARVLTLTPDGDFSTNDGATGSWAIDDGHLVLTVEAGRFRRGDAEADAGYVTSSPYELDAGRLHYFDATYERAPAPSPETP